MISSYRPATLKALRYALIPRISRPQRIKTLSLQQQPPVTRPDPDRFHRHCRILFTRQVKTLISIALLRADLTTAHSNSRVPLFPIRLTTGPIPKILWKTTIRLRSHFFKYLQENPILLAVGVSG